MTTRAHECEPRVEPEIREWSVHVTGAEKYGEKEDLLHNLRLDRLGGNVDC